MSILFQLKILPVVTTSDGSGSSSLPLGTNPALATLTGYAQVAILDPAQVAGWAFSNGLAVQFCN